MKLSVLAVVAVFIQPAMALANPTWTERLSATAVSGAHILIPHAYDGSVPNNTLAKFHGTSHSDWAAGTGTSADTGSGTRTLQVREICDCHVPVNTLLHYQLSPIFAYTYNPGGCDIMGSEFGSADGPCRDACAAADARDAAAPADGASPDLADAPTTPSTGDAQGNGGTTGSSNAGDAALSTGIATGGATGSGGEPASASSAGASGSGGSSSVETSTGQGGGKTGGGACTLAPSAHAAASPLVWVLAALALAVARRRRP